MVLPTHSPYDRQMLREHLELLASRFPALTLGVHGVRWTVRRGRSVDSRCSTCTQSLGRLSCNRGGDVVASCLDCAVHSGHNAREEGTIS
jgi:hypothetical protein